MGNKRATFDPNGLRVTYIDEFGNRTVHSGGNKAWRNNNPGALMYTKTTQGYGAIGKDDFGIAIFPDVETGHQAQRKLLRGPIYRNSTLHHGISDYLGDDAKPGKLDQYRNRVRTWANLDLGRTYGNLNDEEFDRLQDAIQRQEGYWRPDPRTRKRIVISGKVERHRVHENPYDTPLLGDVDEQ